MKTLLEKEIVLTEEDEKTNIPFDFYVENTKAQMKITYRYSPKNLQDEAVAEMKAKQCLIKDAGDAIKDYPEAKTFLPIVNLVTLSLDDPEGFRGCAHRHDCEQEHIISENFASPGFLKGKIQEGQWQIMLNVHALVTEKCCCKLKVEAGDADE